VYNLWQPATHTFLSLKQRVRSNKKTTILITEVILLHPQPSAGIHIIRQEFLKLTLHKRYLLTVNLLCHTNEHDCPQRILRVRLKVTELKELSRYSAQKLPPVLSLHLISTSDTVNATLLNFRYRVEHYTSKRMIA